MGRRILIVDDEDDILEMYSMRLQKEGYLTCTCDSGERALQELPHFDPELVILDIMMPGMDGLQVCEAIRKENVVGGPLILFLTAKSEDYDLLEGFVRGADGYLVKPVEMADLLTEVDRLLQQNA